MSAQLIGTELRESIKDVMLLRREYSAHALKNTMG
jgi:hypothetical protein